MKNVNSALRSENNKNQLNHSIEPENAKMLTERAVLELGTGNNQKAAAYFKKALSVDPSYIRAAEYLQQN